MDKGMKFSLILATASMSFFGTGSALGKVPEMIADVVVLREANLGANADVVYLKGYFHPGDGGQGLLIRLPHDTKASDDGTCVFATAEGNKYYRESCEHSVTPQQAGARANRILLTTNHISLSDNGYLLTIAAAHFSKADAGKEIVLPPIKGRTRPKARIRDIVDETHIRLVEPLALPGRYSCQPRACTVTYGHDDAQAFDRLMAAADTHQSPIRLGSKGYLLSHGIIWNAAKVSVKGDGAVLDFSLMKGGVATTVSVSGNVGSEIEKIGRIISRPNGGYTIVCNWDGATSGAETGITFIGLDQTGAPSVTISDASINSCKHGVKLPGTDTLRGAGLTDVTLDRLRLQDNQYGIYAAPAKAVASEKIAVINSFIVNNRDAGIALFNPSYEMQIANTSIDGSKIGIYAGGSQIQMQGGHMEAITGYYADAADAGSVISISNSSIVMSWTRSLPLFHSGKTTSAINLEHNIIIRFASASFTGDTIADGPGRFIIRDPVVTIQGGPKPLPLFADETNAIADGAFSKGNISGWTYSNEANVKWDGTAGHKRPGALLISGSGFAQYAFPCHPGAYAGVQGYIKLKGLNKIDGKLHATLLWLNTSGKIIKNASKPIVFGDLASWTRLRSLGDVQVQGYAPPGTAFAAALFEVKGARTGKSKAWVDDINGFCY